MYHACSDEENEDDDEDDDEKYFSAEEGDFEGEGFESYLANRRGNRSRSGSGIARDGDRDSSSDSEGRRSESKVAKVLTHPHIILEPEPYLSIHIVSW